MLSIIIVGLEGDVGALSNNLASLNIQLVANYIHQSEKASFAVTNLNVSGALPVKGAPISFNDLKDLPVIVLPGYLPPISMTTNPQEVSGQVTNNGVYLYESSFTPESGLSRLTSFTDVTRYSNLPGWPVVVSFSVPAHAIITKYALRAGVASRSLRRTGRSAS